MARKGVPRAKEPLPPPLPPETRTVGQLVAESIRFYRQNFARTLMLGLPVALLTQVSIEVGRGPRLSHERAYDLLRGHGASVEEAVRFGNLLVEKGVRDDANAVLTTAVTAGLGAVMLTVAFIAASVLVGGVRLDRRSGLNAATGGALVFVPVPLLATFFVLPAIAWLAFLGLVVPVAVIERRGYGESLRRATQLARADFVHALGSLATLVIVYFVTRLALIVLLHSAGESTTRTAVFLADVVLSPLLFVGGVLLYYDQAARVKSRQPARERRRDADVPHAHDADGPRAPDPAVES
jgi:hypothetical protein